MTTGFHFPPHGRRERRLDIPTLLSARDPGYTKLPVVESVIGGNTIHDTFVTVRFVGTTHKFLFCYSYDFNLPRNRALAAIAPGVAWNGELVVMRAGDRDLVTNLRGDKAAVLKATRA
jgi:hypothetical protein